MNLSGKRIRICVNSQAVLKPLATQETQPSLVRKNVPFLLKNLDQITFVHCTGYIVTEIIAGKMKLINMLQ